MSDRKVLVETAESAQDPQREAPLMLLPGGKTDAELLEGLKRRDPSAIGKLYDRYHEHVNGLVWRLLGADSSHDDVVQQVFLSAIRSAHTVQDSSALRTWMVRVTVNAVRRELRGRHRGRWMILTDRLPEVPDPRSSTEDYAFVRRCVQLIEQMKPEDRVVFSLRHLEAFSLDEVASACDCSVATVKRRLARATRRFLKRAKNDFMLSDRVKEVRDDS